MLFHLEEFRRLCLHHAVISNCLRDTCLTCELGFLFCMLEDAHGRNCHATNFLRAFERIRYSSSCYALKLIILFSS